MPPKLYSYLYCCKAAVDSMQFVWWPQSNQKKWNRLLNAYTHPHNNGPPQTGWATIVGDHGSIQSYFVNISFCPFCGVKVDETTAWRK